MRACPSHLEEAREGAHEKQTTDPTHELVEIEVVPGATGKIDFAMLFAQLNKRHLDRYPGEADLEARIASYELAARMQVAAKEALDVLSELVRISTRVRRPPGCHVSKVPSRMRRRTVAGEIPVRAQNSTTEMKSR